MNRDDGSVPIPVTVITVGAQHPYPGLECYTVEHRESRFHVGSDGYLLVSYRMATAPDPSSSRLTSFKSTSFDSPANNVGPWPAILGCTTNSYSSINPSSANACGSVTPPT